MNNLQCTVDVYATKGGEYLGKAEFKGFVPFKDVVKPDKTDTNLTNLLASDETTECLVMGNKQVIYGYECYFKPHYLHWWSI